MFGEILFFEYIAAIFLGLSGLALILMCLIHGDNKKEATYKNMRNFLMFSFLVGLSFFIFYYREVILEVYDVGSFWRAADYAVSIGFTFTWTRLVYSLIDQERLKKLYFWTKVIFGFDILTGCAMAVFMMDVYYYVEDSQTRLLAIIGHSSFTAIVILLILIYMAEGIRELVERQSRRFVGITSVLLVLWEITNLVFNIEFLYGVYEESSWGGKVFDPTGVLLIGVNLMAILFIYKTDFSPMFTIRTELAASEPKSDFSEVIDQIAETHHLTEREREILILAYHGYTNPDIAEKLDISFNTAKRHMHHIFEKLDVNSRVELVHMINSQM